MGYVVIPTSLLIRFCVAQWNFNLDSSRPPRGSSGLFFWRTRSGVEVDLVVYGAAGFWAIEVRNAARVRPEDLKGLQAFGADYPDAELVLLYRGSRRERRRRIRVLPVEEFLRHLVPARSLPL